MIVLWSILGCLESCTCPLQTGILGANTGALVVSLAVCMIRGKTLAHVMYTSVAFWEIISLNFPFPLDW